MTRSGQRLMAAPVLLVLAGAVWGLTHVDLPLLLSPYRGAHILPADNVVLQETPFSCGVAVLEMFLAARGREGAAVDRVLAALEPGTEGLSLNALQKTAGDLDVATEVWNVAPADLSRLPTPAIGLIADEHYVLIERIELDRNRAVLVDPTIGRMELPLGRLRGLWSGPSLLESRTDGLPAFPRRADDGVSATHNGAGELMRDINSRGARSTR